jgi:hypothetical protein
MVTTMARAFTDAFSIKNSSMESGCRTSDGHAAIVEPALAIVKRAWPSVVRVASAYNYHDVSRISRCIRDFSFSATHFSFASFA